MVPEGERVEWRIQVKQGSNLIGVLPGPGVPVAPAMSVRQAIVASLEQIESRPEEPSNFTERALKSVRRLTTTLRNHEGDDTILNIWDQQVAVPITRHLAENVIELLGEYYTASGFSDFFN